MWRVLVATAGRAKPPLLQMALASLALTLVAGCGAAGLVLKSPLSERCTDAGLKGCPELVDGVLDYIDGNKTEGMAKLKKGAAENAPDKIQEFAAELQPLLKLPGVESYAQPIKEIVDLLASSAKSASTRKVPVTPEDDGPPATTVVTKAEAEHDLINPYRTGQPRASSVMAPWPTRPTAAASIPNLDVAHMRTSTVVPATDAKALACEGPLAIVPGGTCARVPVMLGPFVVTDVFAPGGCGDQLFVSTGNSEGAHGWTMFNAAVGALSIHGMQLVVQSDERLYVGARTEKGLLRSDALRCTVTLSGWRPDALE
jgi:hypothetical protein